MQPVENRPPYVQFEMRAVENRTASLEAGHYVTVDVPFAVITPAGTRDRIEKEAEPWLADLKRAVTEREFPEQWYHAYSDSFKRWCETRETPEFGTPIVNWPALSPSQVRALLDANIRTIEDLAEATEEGIARIGMGARALKEKARAWLDVASNTGRLSSELEALRVENADLKRRDKERDEKLKDLETQIKALKAK